MNEGCNLFFYNPNNKVKMKSLNRIQEFVTVSWGTNQKTSEKRDVEL